MMRRLKQLPALMLALSLTACSRAASDLVVEAHSAQPPRILLADYPLAWQNKMRGEFDGLSESSLLKQAMIDYNVLRRAICAAEMWTQPACKRMRGEIAK